MNTSGLCSLDQKTYACDNQDQLSPARVDAYFAKGRQMLKSQHKHK